MAAPANKSPKENYGCGLIGMAGFFVAGCAILFLMIWTVVIPEYRANNLYVESRCTILDNRVEEQRGEGGLEFCCEFLIRHIVDGRAYETWTYKATGPARTNLKGKERLLNRYEIGQQFPCWYDPDDPSQAVLVQQANWFLYAFTIFLLLFVALGAFGFLHFWRRRGKSLEMVAALESGLRTSQNVDEGHSEYPFVPRIRVQRNADASFGYRLPLGTLWSVGKWGCLVFATLFWNGIALPLSAGLIYGISIGEAGFWDFCSALFMIPFLIVGLALVVGCIYMTAISMACRRSIVDLDTHPLVPGQSARLQITQRGPLPVRHMKVLVACDESATYEHGDGSKTDTKRLHEITIDIDPWKLCGQFQIPVEAMHSFQATSNDVHWKILITGQVAGWFPINWEYPLVVLPALAPREAR